MLVFDVRQRNESSCCVCHVRQQQTTTRRTTTWNIITQRHHNTTLRQCGYELRSPKLHRRVNNTTWDSLLARWGNDRVKAAQPIISEYSINKSVSRLMLKKQGQDDAYTRLVQISLGRTDWLSWWSKRSRIHVHLTSPKTNPTAKKDYRGDASEVRLSKSSMWRRKHDVRYFRERFWTSTWTKDRRGEQKQTEKEGTRTKIATTLQTLTHRLNQHDKVNLARQNTLDIDGSSALVL